MTESKEFIKGASGSLTQTIEEIIDFLNDGDKRPDVDYRGFLHGKIADLGTRWYKKGFKIGGS